MPVHNYVAERRAGLLCFRSVMKAGNPKHRGLLLTLSEQRRPSQLMSVLSPPLPIAAGQKTCQRHRKYGEPMQREITGDILVRELQGLCIRKPFPGKTCDTTGKGLTSHMN